MAAIQTVRQRQSLPSRREPYWHLLGTGQHVGFRVADENSYWIARSYDPGTRKRVYCSLGDLSAVADSERFCHAARAAHEWFAHLSSGGQAKVQTVGDAFKAYVSHQRKRKGEHAAADAEARYKRHIEHDPIARIALMKLTARHVDAWRTRLAETPAVHSRRGPRCRVTTPPPPPKPRAAATLNRDFVAMRAALNLAKHNGYVTSNLAWARSLEPLENARNPRDVYLTRDQRRQLLDAIRASDLRAFVRALCLLPLRPGALAALRVGDFNARLGSVTIKRDKANAGRTVPLPDAAKELFRECARGKLPAAPLFARADGEAWNKDSWKLPVKTAVRAVDGIPEATTLYALRHSTITDLVVDGLDLFSVSALAGTSVRMIEKTYAHLQHDIARAALDRLAL